MDDGNLDQRFSSFAEWSEAANQGASRRDADTPVLAGQRGRRRRATREELMALVELQRARYAVPVGERGNRATA